MEATHFYVNGVIVPVSEAKVSVLDHGFTVADGIFETLKVFNGQAFAIELHNQRLAHSAKGLGIACPPSDKIRQAINDVLAANPFCELGRIRVTVSSGIGPLGSDRVPGDPTLVVTLASQKPWPETTTGLVVNWIRNERSALVGLKTVSYAENVIALEHAHKHGYSEAIFFDSKGNLSEGTGSNIFLVKDGALLTPSADCGLLKGITRNLVMQMAESRGIPVKEGLFTIDDLANADEAFLTSSTRDVHPLTAIGFDDQSKRIEFAVGPITQALRDDFASLLASDVDPTFV